MLYLAETFSAIAVFQMARGATLKDKTGLAILWTNLVFSYALASHPLGFYLFKIFSAIKEGHAAIMGSYCTVQCTYSKDT